VRGVLAKKRLRISHVAAILVCALRSSQLRDVARSANRALNLVNSRLTGKPEVIGVRRPIVRKSRLRSPLGCVVGLPDIGLFIST